MLRQKFNGFTKELVNAHHSDVYIPPEKLVSNQNLAGSQSSVYNPKPPVAQESDAKKQDESKIIGRTTTLKLDTEFVCSAQDLFDALTRPDRVPMWSRSRAEISPVANQPFSIFDGNVTGEITKIESPSTLEMKWRLRSWPANFYSNAKIYITAQSESVTLYLVHEGIPIGELDTVERNWKGYYFNAIKSAFGYGAVF